MERWVEEIEGWDERPFSGGYAGLHDLAEDSFSGAVSAGSTWLLFVNGRVVSVGEYRQTASGEAFEPGEPGPDGDIAHFEDAEGVCYEAPHPAVPLLVAMQLADGEARGRYYTEETPIGDVRETLSEGGFTGYIELSENVLSGDYYTVYQAGRSMDVAFVGNARRLRTDEEALELTRDEVGIYEVVAVDLDVTELPESADRESSGSAGVAAGTNEHTTAEPGDRDPGTGGDPETTDTVTTDTDGDAPTADATDHEPTSEPATPTAETEDDEGADEDTATVGVGSDDSDSTDADVSTTAAVDPDTTEDTTGVDDSAPAISRIDAESAAPTAADTDPGDRDRPTDAPSTPPDETDASTDASTGEATSGANPNTGQSDESDAAPAERLAARSIPSLDPHRTTPEDGTADERSDESTGDDLSESTPSGRTEDSAEVETLREAVATVEAERDEARAELAEVESELERVTAERNQLVDERDELEAEADRLRARVAELEERVDRSGEGRSLSVAEALADTNLLVRYESKGKTTVEDVHDGSGSPEDLAANLHISAHTQFESEGASVAGKPFDEWLHGSQQYRFVEWLVSQLVFEIRDTASADALRDLYDALPRIDRVEFDAAIPVSGDGDSGDCTFDVVCHDRMGAPLVVANLDTAREPVEEAEMAELVRDAIDVCRSETSFAAAFYVTAAFFESPALETAGDATSSSLLSRDSRKSYVKESRKRGFHLGLVESRDGSFHLSMPNL